MHELEQAITSLLDTLAHQGDWDEEFALMPDTRAAYDALAKWVGRGSWIKTVRPAA